MNKYFELRENNQVLYGIIENIPEKVTIEEIKARIEASEETKSIEIIDDEIVNPDVVMDWLTIDYHQGFDEEYVILTEKLETAIKYGVEAEVVYSALKFIKNNPTSSITEAINYAMTSPSRA
jgi:hypothetical protein